MQGVRVPVHQVQDRESVSMRTVKKDRRATRWAKDRARWAEDARYQAKQRERAERLSKSLKGA